MKLQYQLDKHNSTAPLYYDWTVFSFSAAPKYSLLNKWNSSGKRLLTAITAIPYTVTLSFISTKNQVAVVVVELEPEDAIMLALTAGLRVTLYTPVLGKTVRNFKICESGMLLELDLVTPNDTMYHLHYN